LHNKLCKLAAAIFDCSPVAIFDRNPTQLCCVGHSFAMLGAIARLHRLLRVATRHNFVVLGTTLLCWAQLCCAGHNFVVLGTTLLCWAQLCCAKHSFTMLGTNSASAEQLVDFATRRQQVGFAKK
jgi:hypothetical protein